MTAGIAPLRLNSGADMPAVGLGVFRAAPAETVVAVSAGRSRPQGLSVAWCPRLPIGAASHCVAGSNQIDNDPRLASAVVSSCQHALR